MSGASSCAASRSSSAGEDADPHRAAGARVSGRRRHRSLDAPSPRTPISRVASAAGGDDDGCRHRDGQGHPRARPDVGDALSLRRSRCMRPALAVVPFGMRSLLPSGIGVLALAAVVRLAAQLPPQTEAQRIQEHTEASALKHAEELARLAMSNAGLLHPSAEASFLRMGEAVRLWKRERNSGPAPLLAEGVLLDCLSRLSGVAVRRLPGEPALPVATRYAAQRGRAAARAFESALRRQPDLIEARLRRARLRAAGDSAALRELEPSPLRKQRRRSPTSPRSAAPPWRTGRAAMPTPSDGTSGRSSSIPDRRPRASRWAR